MFRGVAARVRAELLEPDALARSEGLAALLQTLGPDDLEGVREGFQSIFLDLGATEQVLLAEWWAGFDPQGAFQWAHESWQAEHPAIVATILRAWARRDPSAAMAGAQVPNADIQVQYTAAVLAGWEESGKPGLLEWVKSRPRGHERQQAIDVIARRKVLREGAPAAFAWAEGLDDEDELFKLNVLRRVASAAAQIDPGQAARWAETLVGGEFGSGLPQRVGTRWARRDPEAALAWLSTLPPGQSRDDAVRETFRRWIRSDGEAATAWIEKTPFAPWLDPAASLMSRRLAGQDTPTALDWARRITDPELRSYSVAVVARVWATRDEPAARAWVDQSDLSPLIKRKIFEIPDHMRPGGLQRAARGVKPVDPASDSETGSDETVPQDLP